MLKLNRKYTNNYTQWEKITLKKKWRKVILMWEAKLIKSVWLNLLVNRKLLIKLIEETKNGRDLIQNQKAEAQIEVVVSISKTIFRIEKNQSLD